ncbi:MAG: MMPL family transporter [Cryomorphaceae bacterium]|nr:MMPL family transporter [Cryomorphaceae bacterium]
MNKKALSRLIQFLKVVSVFLYLASLCLIENTTLNYDMESFFASEDDNVQFYNSFKEKFENENNYLQIGLSRRRGILDSLFLAKVDDVAIKIERINGVESTLSPTSEERKLKLPIGGFTGIPVLHIHEPKKYQGDFQFSKEVGDFYSTLISDDTSSIRVLIHISDSITSAQGREVYRQVTDIISDEQFDDVAFAGRLATQSYYLREMKSEMILFVSVVILVLVISLGFLLRSFYLTILTMLIVSGGIFGTFAIINLTGNSIDLMVIMTPAILLIIGSSSAIHFFNDLRIGFQLTGDRTEAVFHALKSSGVPIFLNTMTTSAGFAILAIIPIAPIQRFGLFSSFGILLTFLFLIGFGSFGAFLRLPQKDLKVKRLDFIKVKFPFGQAATALLIGISVLGMIAVTQMKASNYFLEDLKEGSDLRSDLYYFEKHFDGVRPFELVVRSKSDRELTSLEFAAELDSLNSEVRRIFEVKYVHSALSFLKSANMAIKGNASREYRLANDLAAHRSMFRVLEKFHILENSKLVHNDHYRFSFRTHDVGSEEMSDRIEKLSLVTTIMFPDLEVSYTGVANLIDYTNASISYYLIQGVLISILISLVVSFLVTRSVLLSFISIIPNLIPLLSSVMVLWFIGSSVNIGTAMIFTVVYGIAVDDTMHFIYRFHQNLKMQQRRNVSKAISLTLHHLKRPMAVSTIILVSGFFVFSLSGFRSISSMGLAVSSALVAALLADIYLLPRLIQTFAFVIEKKNTKHSKENHDC